MKYCKGRRHAGGFTLIEIVAVVVIMALMSAACVLTLSHTLNSATQASVRQEIEQADQLVRSAARQSGHRQSLTIDLDRGSLIWGHPDDQGQQGQPITMVQLKSGWSIQSVQSDSGLDNYAQRSGKLELQCGAGGQMPTYSLQLRDPSGKTYRMIAAGLSGQLIWLDGGSRNNASDGTDDGDDTTAADIFASLAANELAGGDATTRPAFDEDASPRSDAH